MTSRSRLWSFWIFVSGSLLLLPGSGVAEEQTESTVPIRIGWQIPAVTQAAIVQVLKRTDVLARHGLDPSLVPFSYGTPEVEAAFEGRLDALFAGDQPAINLLASGGKWKIVARLYYDRVGLVVPPGSPATDVEDLRGLTVASPFGSVAHREAVLQQQSAGLDPEADVANVSMDILNIRNLVLAGGIENWDGVDAAALWEPNVSSFELGGLTRKLSEKRILSVVVMSDQFLSKYPDAAVQFLIALSRAWEYFARHPQEVLRWYLDDTQLDFSMEALLAAASIDPNFTAGSLREVSLELTEEHVSELERNAAWGVEHWRDGSEIRRFVDQSPLAEARQQIATSDFQPVGVILPSVTTMADNRRNEELGLSALPLAVVFGLMLLIAIVAIEFGVRLGRRAKERYGVDGEADENSSIGAVRPIATVVGAILGMMAFVIALTFGSATSRFDARKTALLEDVTTIQTAYLRADLVPEPHRTTVRSLLRDYVQARAGIVHAYGQPETLRLIQRRTEAMQQLMWSHVQQLMHEDDSGRTSTLFASALNDVFNLHTKRVVLGAYYRIPDFLWWALIFASGVAMLAVGFQFGFSGSRRVHTTNAALAVTFALVTVLAFDLDRAGEGLVAVNQQPMIDLYQSMSN